MFLLLTALDFFILLLHWQSSLHLLNGLTEERNSLVQCDHLLVMSFRTKGLQGFTLVSNMTQGTIKATTRNISYLLTKAV